MLVVGAALGVPLGTAVGVAVGTRVGFTVGIDVGAVVGGIIAPFTFPNDIKTVCNFPKFNDPSPEAGSQPTPA